MVGSGMTSARCNDAFMTTHYANKAARLGGRGGIAVRKLVNHVGRVLLYPVRRQDGKLTDTVWKSE